MRIKLILILFALLCFASNQAKAQVSGELHYRWVSDSTYEFTYVHYRKCGSCWINANVVMYGESPSSQFGTPIIFLTAISVSQGSLPLPKDISNCSQNTYRNILSGECYDEHVYRGIYKLPVRARDWKFWVNRNCPTDNDNFSGLFSYAECGINNLDFLDSLAKNTSPMWMNRRPNIPGHLSDTVINYPIKSTCRNRTYDIDLSVKEYEGDIVRYDIPKHGKFTDTTFANYLNGFSKNYVMPTDTPPSFSIDSLTGHLLFKPIKHNRSGAMWNSWTNYYYQPFIVREYRMDTTWAGGNPVVKRKQLGYITRSVRFVVTPDSLCADSNVQFVDSSDRLPTTFIDLSCWDDPFRVSLSNTIRCNTVDSNGSCFLLVHSLSGDTIPIQKAEAECRLDNIADDINIFTSTTLDTGLYYLYIKKGDDGNSMITECGLELTMNDSLRIYMLEGPEDPTLLKDSTGSTISALEANCRSWTMAIYPSYPISCKSLRIDGSDFYLVDSTQNPPRVAQIKKVIRGVCQNGFLEDFTLQFDSPIEPGNYKLYLVKGSDGNTLVDACHRKWPFLVTDVSVPSPELDIGPDYQFCSRDTFNISLSLPQGINGQWSTGAYRNSINVNAFGSYWVKMITPNGCSAIDTVHITELNCTGIEEALGGADFTIYPNPSSGQFTIEFSQNSSGQLSIQSSIGSLVYSENIQDKEKSTITLPSSITEGFYVVKFETRNRVYSERLVLSRD